MSDRLVEQLILHEGKEKLLYYCNAGYPTIGVGRMIGRGGVGLSDDEITYLLRNDIARTRKELDRAFDWFEELDSVRQDGLTNLGFNIGLPSLKKFKRALAAMEIKDYEEASREFLNSKWAKDVGSRRSIQVADMIRIGEYPL